MPGRERQGLAGERLAWCQVLYARAATYLRPIDSATYHVMEAAACASSAVFAGMRLTEIASPRSVLEVFDPTLKCKHDQTYTIWAGVDFEIMLPDGTIISKSEFLLQELEKYMAARV